MKKLLTAALVLVFVLCAAFACAEQGYYVEVGTLDADGNITEIADLTNPMVIGFDDETMECAYGTQDETVQGTCEVTDQDEECATIVATFEGEDPVTFLYFTEQDVFTLTDEAAGVTYVFLNAEDTMDAATEEGAA